MENSTLKGLGHKAGAASSIFLVVLTEFRLHLCLKSFMEVARLLWWQDETEGIRNPREKKVSRSYYIIYIIYNLWPCSPDVAMGKGNPFVELLRNTFTWKSSHVFGNHCGGSLSMHEPGMKLENIQLVALINLKALSYCIVTVRIPWLFVVDGDFNIF